MSERFDILPLKKELLNNLAELNFNSMTPIQVNSLYPVLEGRDIIAQAKTGSGKTAVFGLGILNDLNLSLLEVQALIICPTRELAEQVAKEIRTLARMLKNVKVLTICGGTGEIHQEKSIVHGAHIVVGTPGRVLRLLKKNSLNFASVKTFVLDEADRMLDMGFHEDIMVITSHLPRSRQTLFFSATFPDVIEELGKRIQHNATFIKVDTDHEIDVIKQEFYELDEHKEKDEALLKILAEYNPDRSLVFCKTKQIADCVAKRLRKSGIVAESIHGDLMQNERTAILTKFSNHSLSVLVATDVAARGLDITDLAAVINFDLPPDPEVYIHRIGRTGRAGKCGLALSLYIKKNVHFVEAIEELTGRKCEVSDLSTISSDKNYDLLPPMKTMYIGGGKKNKLRPGDILGALVGEAKVDASAVGDISIFNILSYVAIRSDCIDEAIKKLRVGKIKNRKFKIGLA